MKNTLTFRRRRKGIVGSHAGAIFRHAARLPCHAEKKADSLNTQDSRPAYERKIYIHIQLLCNRHCFFCALVIA